jgi:hypothetical protein
MAKVLWTQKQDVGPSARGGHATTYDAARQRVMLFGGRATGGTVQGDTWEWDGQDWTQVADTGPDARSGHALAFDANRQRALLFGGEAAGSALRADTWEWDGHDWTQVADTGPDARSGHALAFDSNRDRAVLFGGEAAGSARRADTWEWDGGDWTQVADTGPGPSLAFAMTFGGEATLLFGGVRSTPPPLVAEELSRLSWDWDGAHWTLRQDIGPAPRWGHALAFDSARGRAVLFGGFSLLPADPGVADSVLGDTWEASLEEIPAEVPGPAVALVSFTLNPDTIPAIPIGGQPASVVSFEVGLDGPAPPGGLQVDVFQEGTVFFSIFVAEGETTGSQTDELTAGVGDYVLEARLGESSLRAVLHVVPTP